MPEIWHLSLTLALWTLSYEVTASVVSVAFNSLQDGVVHGRAVIAIHNVKKEVCSRRPIQA